MTSNPHYLTGLEDRKRGDMPCSPAYPATDEDRWAYWAGYISEEWVAERLAAVHETRQLSTLFS